MKYIDNLKKEFTLNPKPGDFIYANGLLRVIIKTDKRYRTLFITGEYAFSERGNAADSIESLISWYRRNCEDFEFISSEEMTLIRGEKKWFL